MIVCFKKKQPHIPYTRINDTVIERITVQKLLGVKINNTLSWSDHIDYIYGKASKRLYFLTLLRRSGLSTKHLLMYYTSIIRPVVEYACPLWHNGLTRDQSHLLELVQKRALKIIFSSKSHQNSVTVINTLQQRRDLLCQSFFMITCVSTDKLNYLIEITSTRTRH